MKKRLKRVVRNPAPEDADKERLERDKIKREGLLEQLKQQSKRGRRVDFTAARKGTKTFRGLKIDRCPDCKRNGELHDSSVWGNSVLFIHKGSIKDEQFNTSKGESCIVTRRWYLISVAR